MQVDLGHADICRHLLAWRHTERPATPPPQQQQTRRAFAPLVRRLHVTQDMLKSAIYQVGDSRQGKGEGGAAE